MTRPHGAPYLRPDGQLCQQETTCLLPSVLGVSVKWSLLTRTKLAEKRIRNSEHYGFQGRLGPLVSWALVSDVAVGKFSYHLVTLQGLLGILQSFVIKQHGF